MKRFVLFCWFGLWSAVAAAAPIAAIDSVQLPAWLDRGGLSVPAVSGTELQSGDMVRTGRGARMFLRLSEGSVVKLGENAQFAIEAAEKKPKIYEAALSVLNGAFRFTTNALAKAQPRDIRFKLASNATIGIRGTDLWGRGNADKDIVCLIEGKIDITGNDGKTNRLDQPLQFFQSTRKAPPEPITLLDQKTLDVLALETELEPGKGATGAGNWKLVIGGFVSRDALISASRQLRNAGFPADRRGDAALVIGRLNGEAEAQGLGNRLAADFGFKSVTIEQ